MRGAPIRACMTDEPLTELLPGGIGDTDAGRIGAWVTKVRGNKDKGQIDDVEVCVVAYDDRAHAADEALTLEIYNDEGELINGTLGDDQSLSRETVTDLEKGYAYVQLNAGEGRIPLPENGRYVLTWGDDDLGEFNRAELFSRILKPLEYAATETLALETARENAHDLTGERDAQDVTGTTNPPATTDEPETEHPEGFTPDDEDVRADSNNTGGVNLGVFGFLRDALIRRGR